MFYREQEDDYDVLFRIYTSRPFNPQIIHTPIFEPMIKIHRNLDWTFCCNIQDMQDNGQLEYKSRRFYNYVLCKKSTLLNMRKLGDRTVTLDTNCRENYIIFDGSIIYFGKATGRRDMEHLKDSIIKLFNLPNKSLKDGEKLNEIILELLDGLGIVIVTAYPDSSHYMAHNREDALIRSTGLENLTNTVHGHTYGSYSDCDETTINNYGFMLKYTFFINYINDGPEPFTLEDVCRERAFLIDQEDRQGDKECEHLHKKCNNCNLIL